MLHKTIKRNLIIFVASISLLVLGACSADGLEVSEASSKDEGKGYPNGTIEMIVPASAGGDTDRNARLLARYLEENLGVSVIVQNVNGASGSVGVDELVKSKPDGNRVLFFHNNILINQILGLTENTYEDLKIAGISAIDKGNGVVVRGDAPYETMEDLLQAAKANPNKLNMGTSVGAFTHFQMLDVMDKAGAEFNLVDTGDFAERNTALLGGQLDVVPMQLGLVQDYLESGDMRAIGVLSKERMEKFPDVPTFVESGVNSVFEKFFFLAFPKDTPDSIVTTFTQAVETATQNEEYISKAKGFGLDPQYLNPEEAEKLISKEADNYKEINEKQK
ncbi:MULTISPECIES: tripartite tricarboxylate transporter substrate binding protein [unclassified Sporosarcina]|uniref:tripartite tricarboxylate transporter substrate binding protein n=1 Tax=unclassified Sporosarcina TaxID=2647733 RepID=UPI00203B54A3|nr:MULTISPECIES: tripartite tricarboxylate transporter substrate binding protein [unclassified Sporosarcina]GKV65918.1 hypothetical protein NCCP2331_20710 [Sporosarcina sp. NCCP-2331]GLB56082.1 hypothetical protein NCCP2378_18690 [Sporosarcina sp. NCCP-2378]